MLLAVVQVAVEQAAKQRYQIDFRVNDAMLAKMLPRQLAAGDRKPTPGEGLQSAHDFHRPHAIMADGGKMVTPHATRMVYLVIPVRQTGTKNVGQMIIHGLTDKAADALGTFGVCWHATTAKM